jgi:hypothetical protein
MQGECGLGGTMGEGEPDLRGSTLRERSSSRIRSSSRDASRETEPRPMTAHSAVGGALRARPSSSLPPLQVGSFD